MSAAASSRANISLEDLRLKKGHEIGCSGWTTIDQGMINDFAKLTDDHQFIHLDPVRARAETPFGGTIAHGFLSLSLLSSMAYQALPAIEGLVMGVNYGFEKIRFLTPVRTGAKLRARFRLVTLDESKSGEVTSTYDVTMEIAGQEKPALVATWLTRAYIAD